MLNACDSLCSDSDLPAHYGGKVPAQLLTRFLRASNGRLRWVCVLRVPVYDYGEVRKLMVRIIHVKGTLKFLSTGSFLFRLTQWPRRYENLRRNRNG